MIIYKSSREQDIRCALAYIPCEVKRKLNVHEKPIIFYTTHDRFGYCSAPETIPYVILVNDIVFPNGCAPDDRMYRFFVFSVLHEVAHVYMDITGIPIGGQDESQADKLAVDWYNKRADKLRLESLSYEHEIKSTQEEVEKMMKLAIETIASSLKSGRESCKKVGSGDVVELLTNSEQLRVVSGGVRFDR